MVINDVDYDVSEQPLFDNTLQCLTSRTNSGVRTTIQKCPNKPFAIDPFSNISTKMLHGATVSAIINTSLRDCVVAVDVKQALVSPLIKNKLWQNELKNYLIYYRLIFWKRL